MPLDFYEIERVFLFKACRSTVIKSNEIRLQAFAARLLLLRHGSSCQAIFSEPQIIRSTFSIFLFELHFTLIKVKALVLTLTLMRIITILIVEPFYTDHKRLMTN